MKTAALKPTNQYQLNHYYFLIYPLYECFKYLIIAILNNNLKVFYSDMNIIIIIMKDIVKYFILIVICYYSDPILKASFIVL